MPNEAKVVITGNLTNDPELRTVNDKQMLSFTVAVNTTLQKPDNSGYETNFYNVSVWSGIDYIKDKLQKGTQVEVIGPLVLMEYVNKNGQPGHSLNIRSAWEVIPRARMKGGNNGQRNYAHRQRG